MTLISLILRNDPGEVLCSTGDELLVQEGRFSVQKRCRNGAEIGAEMVQFWCRNSAEIGAILEYWERRESRFRVG